MLRPRAGFSLVGDARGDDADARQCSRSRCRSCARRRRALGATAGRLDADQIARYAQRAMDHDLRVASADVGQPLLVHAGPMAVSFNANLLAADSTDPGALDVLVGADSTLTEAWRVAQAGTLPLTARTYPTADYPGVDGGLSRNETISYFLRPDTVSGRSDVYVLYRKVNARDSVQIVRGIHVPDDSAFFSYFTASGIRWRRWRLRACRCCGRTRRWLTCGRWGCGRRGSTRGRLIRRMWCGRCGGGRCCRMRRSRRWRIVGRRRGADGVGAEQADGDREQLVSRASDVDGVDG
jgi:hypothetical protein